VKTIFKKLLLVYLIVLFIAYIIISVGANYVLQYFFINEKKTYLLEQAEHFNKVYVDSLKTGPLNALLIKSELDSFQKYTNSSIWLIKGDGRLLLSDEQNSLIFNDSGITVSDLKTVFNKNIITKRGYISGIVDQVLVIGYPITIDNKVAIAMFMMLPMPEIYKTTAAIFNITVIALTISGIIAFVVLFIVTRKINREIVGLTEAVRYIAKGNFDKKIKVSRNDELGELAKSFNHMAEELCKQEANKRKFISNLSHDLRSPLTSITGYTRGILDGTIEKTKQDRYLQIVLNESERLTKMVNDMLDLSAMEGGNLTLNKTDFDINSLLLNELDKFESRIIEKKIKLEIDLYKEKILAHGDIENIRRVIYNLIDNALKFIDIEGKLTIKSEVKEDKILVGIQNTGTVIPKDELKNIWKRFTKLDNSRGMERKSTGLGLSIVREIIKAHEEKIEVYSNEEIGVIFIFSLSTQIFKKNEEN